MKPIKKKRSDQSSTTGKKPSTKKPADVSAAPPKKRFDKKKPPSAASASRMKLNAAKTKLEQLHAYKQILKEEGLFPSEDDKMMESELIVKTLRLERQLAQMEGKPKPPTRKYKFFSARK